MEQPKTSVKFDQRSFEIARNKIKNMAKGKREREEDPAYATKIPQEFSLKLTNSCDLRCTHCFQWGEDGFHKNYEMSAGKNSLSFETVSKIFSETRPAKSNVYLWGGEPMIYPRWDDLMLLLKDDPREVICTTNGMHIERKIDSMIPVSENLVIVFSIDGFEGENDILRGDGVFKRAMHGIDLLLDLKKKGIYKGGITISCLIGNTMVDRLYEFIEFFEKKGVDSVYLVFPWYIPKNIAIEMDQYYEKEFAWLESPDVKGEKSWHSFSYHLETENVSVLLQEMRRIRERTWNIRVRYQPAVEFDEVENYVLGLNNSPVENKKTCLGISNRMEVLPNGDVTPCKQFPEFVVGNLNESSVSEVWLGDNFKRFRSMHSTCGLMPICARCVTLYLNGI